MYKAVVFDLDGTLLHTIPDIAASMNRALRNSSLPERDTADFSLIIGGGARSCVVNACPAGTPEEKISRVFEDFQSIYHDNCCIVTELYSDIQELISQLKIKDIRLAVVTNKTESTAKKIIHNYFGDYIFEYILGDSESYPPKPDPESALYLCGIMGIDPAQVLYTGDSGSDMVYGRNAGFYPVGALWGYRAKAELLESGAAALAENPLQILSYLD